ncbi:MAG: hypothetical protein IH840_10275 [Candidatus Heimdallarchaeota archaeon]|nr:hypothetical protein [Candidatus Heimdallarchaeota archaeon]
MSRLDRSTFPTDENLTLDGIVQISWSGSIDTFEHQIIYSLHYSDDGGSLWTQLTTNLTSLSLISTQT